MPRTAPLLNAVVFDKNDTRRISAVSTVFSETELSDTKTGEIVNIIHDANMDGVRYLKDENRSVRYAWSAVLILFLFLALFQITSQIMFFIENPIATNVEVEYPDNITFPAVAICNNNQFRMTYITGAWLANRNADEEPSNSNISVFEKALLNSWTMDAVFFMRKAAHSKNRMILKCTWPNGTACYPSDFKPVWTMTGLCWAINTNLQNALHVTGSGSGHGLKLLLNVESYERIEACSQHFRSHRLPGLKIVIFNQTDIPETSLSGVNVPAGHSIDIPLKMQRRQKLENSACIEENDEQKAATSNFSSPHNIRTCTHRHYLKTIERICQCSFGKIFDSRAYSALPFCTVGDYFKCVSAVIDRVRETGKSRKCSPPCDTVQYTAWQDMNRLPRNLMPPLVEGDEQDDEMDVEDDEDNEDLDHLKCGTNNMWLTDMQVGKIKRAAHHAFEKQSRYQEDVKERTRRMIERLRGAVSRVTNSKWGWHAEDLYSPYDRLLNGTACFQKLANAEETMFPQMNRPSHNNEESRTKQIYSLVDTASFERNPDKFKTIGGLKEYYGQRVEDIQKEANQVISVMEKLWLIFDVSSYNGKVSADLSRMDRIFELMQQYEKGGIQRRVWAEKMQSRQMKHFFEEEFMEGWSSPILRDIEKVLLKSISELETTEWASINKSIESGSAAKIGALMFFSSADKEKKDEFQKLLFDMYACATVDVKEEGRTMLADFKKAMRELQSAYNNLFKKELPDYLDLYEFGDSFERENFAIVNIFMHEMHLEHWKQYQTYSFWSLACDIGGAIGLFLGASLLTLIEMIYLCIKHGICSRSSRKNAMKWVREVSQYRKKSRAAKAEEGKEKEEEGRERKRNIFGSERRKKISTIHEEEAFLPEDDNPEEALTESDYSAQGLFSSTPDERQTSL